MKMNNKGFTLVEVLAVLVILSIITGLAIPAFSSSLEKNEQESKEKNKQIFQSAMEIFLTDYKKEIYSSLVDSIPEKNKCYLSASFLRDSGYVSEEILKNVCGQCEDISNYYVLFTKPNKFELVKGFSYYSLCSVLNNSDYQTDDAVEGSDEGE